MIQTEQGVVDAVRSWMQSNGFVDVEAVVVGRPGFDIQGVHRSTGEHWLIEAKGGAHSGRDDSNRVCASVAGAFMSAAAWLYKPELAGKRVAIAVPVSRWFSVHIGRIEGALMELGISVFTVSDDGEVTLVDNLPNCSSDDKALETSQL